MIIDRNWRLLVRISSLYSWCTSLTIDHFGLRHHIFGLSLNTSVLLGAPSRVGIPNTNARLLPLLHALALISQPKILNFLRSTSSHTVEVIDNLSVVILRPKLLLILLILGILIHFLAFLLRIGLLLFHTVLE